ncbi:VCBS domain-containing protein, partial [Acidimangrovimonas pyrenivorans]
YGSFAVNADTGVWSYTLDNAAAAVQALAEGEQKTESFTVTVTDDQGATATQQVAITVTGTNDAPKIAGMAGLDYVQEDATLTDTAQIVAEDRDNGAVLTYSGDADGVYGHLAVDPTTGALTYTLDNSSDEVQALGAGDVVHETFTVSATDEFNATTSQDVTFSVLGTNDAPVVDAVQTTA